MENKDLNKEKQEISEQEEKEDKALNEILPITVMIGIIVGMILSFKFNNFLYFGGCTVAGLLAGIIFSSIKAEGGIEFSKKEKKK